MEELGLKREKFRGKVKNEKIGKSKKAGMKMGGKSVH